MVAGRPILKAVNVRQNILDGDRWDGGRELADSCAGRWGGVWQLEWVVGRRGGVERAKVGHSR